mmetsp:Transcript_31044/g.84951  ORF Transcript_31044/g.84951 Transcript_31044/m.84951 type:complete len:227 (+) Transcript_31044:117-797(+)
MSLFLRDCERRGAICRGRIGHRTSFQQNLDHRHITVEYSTQEGGRAVVDRHFQICTGFDQGPRREDVAAKRGSQQRRGSTRVASVECRPGIDQALNNLPVLCRRLFRSLRCCLEERCGTAVIPRLQVGTRLDQSVNCGCVASCRCAQQWRGLVARSRLQIGARLHKYLDHLDVASRCGGKQRRSPAHLCRVNCCSCLDQEACHRRGPLSGCHEQGCRTARIPGLES